MPRGSNNNKNVVVAELFSWNDGEAQTYLQYRHENQQRSLLGVSNDSGFRKAKVDYGEYGLAHLKKILWDGRDPGYFDSVVLNNEQMIVTLTALGGLNQPVTSDMLGALARVVTPTQSPYVYFGRVIAVNPGSDEFTIEDPTGDLYTAMDTYGGMLTVFDHHDKSIDSGATHTAGLWTSNPSYGSSITTFTNSGSHFPAYAEGWTLQPDARYPVFYPIVSAAAGSITVAGDVTGTLPDVTENDVYYFLIPPAGVDRTDGSLSLAPTEPVSRYLAFQYFYLPPVVGVYVDDERVDEAGIYGRQAGDNLASQYYCWHRFYQPDTGRWTTPDPAMSPWTNLLGYCGEVPVRASDPSGLLGPLAAYVLDAIVVCTGLALGSAAITALTVHKVLGKSERDSCIAACRAAVHIEMSCIVTAVSPFIPFGAFLVIPGLTIANIVLLKPIEDACASICDSLGVLGGGGGLKGGGKVGPSGISSGGLVSGPSPSPFGGLGKKPEPPTIPKPPLPKGVDEFWKEIEEYHRCKSCIQECMDGQPKGAVYDVAAQYRECQKKCDCEPKKKESEVLPIK